MAATRPTQSPYKDAEIEKWKTLLVNKRHEIFEDIGSLERSAMDIDDTHTAPTHQADRGSDADYQDTNLRLAENERVILWQIDRALKKIRCADPIPFGICEHTLKPIPKNRLNLLPWTPLSIEGAEHMEENDLEIQDMLIDG